MAGEYGSVHSIGRRLAPGSAPRSGCDGTMDLRGGTTQALCSPRKLASGEIEAVFLPARGMLCASLRHRGEEMLRCVENLEQVAARGSMAGVPLMHPWANRLSGFRYRAAGQDVVLDPASPLLHFDQNGLPIHGVPWPLLAWELTKATGTRLVARLDWNRRELLDVFPFEHTMEMTVAIDTLGLTIETELIAGNQGPVPVSFGFHPYIGVPGLARDEWRLKLPAMRRLMLDSEGIPTGKQTVCPSLGVPLAGLDFDDGFALESRGASLGISGAGRRISIDLLAGYRYVQVYAPRGQAYIALEPMTAPTNALISGNGLNIVTATGRFHAAFRIRVEAPGS